MPINSGMGLVTYKSFKALSAVPMAYTIASQVEVPQEYKVSSCGVAFYDSAVMQNARDLVLARGTASLLTAAIDLSSVVRGDMSGSTLGVGETPCSVRLLNRSSTTKGVSLSGQDLRWSTDSTKHVSFSVSPLGGDVVEVRVGNLFLQIDESYPFTARLDTPLDDEHVHLQQFKVELTDSDLMSLRVNTSAGWRYLACGSDNILRATGVILNQVTVNDYYFYAQSVTATEQDIDYTPTDEWIAYHMSASSREHNSDVDVKHSVSAPTHMLVTSPLATIAETGTAEINVCRLRTNFNSKGSASTFNNG